MQVVSQAPVFQSPHKTHRYLYIKNHVSPMNNLVYRVISLRHVQWMEYDPDTNQMKIQMMGKPDPDLYMIPPELQTHDPHIVKRTFFTVLRELRSDGEFIEGW